MQYEMANETGLTNYSEIQSTRMEMDSHRQNRKVGVKVRRRVQDSLSNEKISKYLIAKQKEISQNKIVHTMTDNNGLELTTFAEIQTHATDFYKILYCKKDCDVSKQEFFLSFLQNELSDADRDLLSSPLTKPEIFKIIQFMAQNKTPGIDGFPVETYEENWDIMGNDLLSIYEAVLDIGRLGDSQRQAIITLIPKTNNVSSINDTDLQDTHQTSI